MMNLEAISNGSDANDHQLIAICQIEPLGSDIQANVNKVIQWMAKAREAGAALALFGELLLSDYNWENPASISETQDGPSFQAISSAAKKLKIAVIYGYSELSDGGEYYNSAMFIDAAGNKIGHYRRTHVWVTQKAAYHAGDKITVVDWSPHLRVGLTICVDICMPEFVCSMVANAGAQVIVCLAALVEDMKYVKTPKILVPARAFENRCYVIYACTVGKKYLGASCVCDSNGEFIVSDLSREEKLLLAKIPLETHKNVPFHYHPLRRPELYTKQAIHYDEKPWIRENPCLVQEYFNHRAPFYDSQMKGIYNAPQIAAKTLTHIGLSKSADILDVAAGTGLVGAALAENGFTSLIALDRSLPMLRCLETKGIYKSVIHRAFEQVESEIGATAYNACVCIGAFLTSGFLDPALAIPQMIRLVIPGGYVLLMWNESELSDFVQCHDIKKNLYEAIESEVTAKRCIKINEERVPNYLNNCMGMLMLLKKC